MAVLSTSANIATPGLPVGSIQAFAGANAPTGWLLCDGSAVRRQDYPDLYNTLGSTYGNGDGSTTFNLPDLRGRMPLGAGTGAKDGASGSGAISGGTALTTRTRGQYGGAQSDQTAWGSSVWTQDWSWSSGSSPATRQVGNPSNTPGDSNLPPFVVTNYIIKAVADIARGGWYTQSSPPFVTQLPTNPAIGEECYYLHTAAGNIGAVAHLRYDGSRWNPIGQTTLCRWNCGSATQVFSSTSVTNVTVGDYGTVTFTPPWDGYYEIGQKTGMWELNSGIGMYTMFSATDGSANYSIHYIQDWNGPYQHHREGESHPIVYYLYASKTYRFTATLTYAAGNTGTINFFGTGYVKAVS